MNWYLQMNSSVSHSLKDPPVAVAIASVPSGANCAGELYGFKNRLKPKRRRKCFLHRIWLAHQLCLGLAFSRDNNRVVPNWAIL